MADFKYDVALSFAREERPYAAALASCLQQRGARVFYDDYERAKLWGVNLYERLHTIYSKEARFFVPFVSRAYAERLWPTHEMHAAEERQLSERRQGYILPILVDDTELPGLFITTGYVRLQEGVPAICDLLIQKLGLDIEAEIQRALSKATELTMAVSDLEGCQRGDRVAEVYREISRLQAEAERLRKRHARQLRAQ